MTLLRLRSKHKTSIGTTHAALESEPERPPLFLLANDATSLTARRLHVFGDASAAAEFVRFWFPPERRAGLTAFWALGAPPTTGVSESVVLIRDKANRDLVYPLSFNSMDRALREVCCEMARGLHIGRVAIYYGVPVSFEPAFDGAVIVTPAEPPACLKSVQERTGDDTPAISTDYRDLDDAVVDRAFEVVRQQRWTSHNAPFAGFGSPPGRF